MNLKQTYYNSISNNLLVNTTPDTATSVDFLNNGLESVFSWIGKSTLSESARPNIREYLRYLDAKVSAVRKTATFWDAYNIRDAATSKDDFIQKYAALPKNASLIINTNKFIINQQVFNRGDIVVKDNNEQQIIIPAREGGVYEPISLTKAANNNLVLEFEYRDAGSGTKQVSIDNIEPPTSDLIYSVTYTNNDFKNTNQTIIINTKYQDEGNIPVTPFWECRELINNLLGEKIFGLIRVSYDNVNKQWIFTANTVDVPFKLIIK